jgi:hypothetical protein
VGWSIRFRVDPPASPDPVIVYGRGRSCAPKGASGINHEHASPISPRRSGKSARVQLRREREKLAVDVERKLAVLGAHC